METLFIMLASTGPAPSVITAPPRNYSPFLGNSQTVESLDSLHGCENYAKNKLSNYRDKAQLECHSARFFFSY